MCSFLGPCVEEKQKPSKLGIVDWTLLSSHYINLYAVLLLCKQLLSQIKACVSARIAVLPGDEVSDTSSPGHRVCS